MPFRNMFLVARRVPSRQFLPIMNVSLKSLIMWVVHALPCWAIQWEIMCEDSWKY